MDVTEGSAPPPAPSTLLTAVAVAADDLHVHVLTIVLVSLVLAPRGAVSRKEHTVGGGPVVLDRHARVGIILAVEP